MNTASKKVIEEDLIESIGKYYNIESIEWNQSHKLSRPQLVVEVTQRVKQSAPIKFSMKIDILNVYPANICGEGSVRPGRIASGAYYLSYKDSMRFNTFYLLIFNKTMEDKIFVIP